MTNAQIADLFEEMSVLLEVESANPFRVRAYQRAAQALASLSQPVSELSDDEILAIPGIGKSIAGHLAEIAASGSFKELLALRAKIPAGLLALLKVSGLGPKRARLLHTELKIDSLKGLKDAARAGRLRQLAGFGEKLETKILEGLDFAQGAGQRMDQWHARQLMDEVVGMLKGLGGVREISPAGSLRRGLETVGDLDVLCTAQDPAAVVSAFARSAMVERVLASGPTKASVILKAKIQCDLRVVPPGSFGAALQYFTGSKGHNVALRELALKMGLSVNEYGVFRVSDAAHKKPLAGRTEQEVYAKLGLAWIPPELRENRGEIEAARKGKLPKLVELADVRGDFHNHSTHTDGANSLEEMARAAQRQGWEWVALGDHSRSLAMVKGLSIERLRATFKELEGIRKKVKGIRLLRSMEVDILKDGSLDYPDEVLDEIDVVVGSVHSAFNLDERAMTERLIRAASNPRLDIMGHLSGRLINRRQPYRFDSERVLAAAAKAGSALELNGQPHRQDVNDVVARRARELGAPLALGSDAHSASQLGYMTLAVTIARRAGLRKEDLVNCLSASDLIKWLKS